MKLTATNIPTLGPGDRMIASEFGLDEKELLLARELREAKQAMHEAEMAAFRAHLQWVDEQFRRDLVLLSFLQEPLR